MMALEPTAKQALLLTADTGPAVVGWLVLWEIKHLNPTSLKDKEQENQEKEEEGKNCW